ncbi:hypothetical protein BHE90_009591 [Fusarium euwallaceae]|uniref:Protein phosphatase 4 core regulatory subunit R2 n=1 Tax=Fusarium euwallaceae TaxID=1147111 RepID=A0A430LJN3_9HYPO|nr:hypothetical protein BHE90_009591 [Fusarium euwallaceae]
MEVDSDNGLLGRVASGCSVEKEAWPALRSDILSRLDSIAHNDFPIPKLPPPPPVPEIPMDKVGSPQPSSPPGDSSQEANKENAPTESLPATQPIEGTLPKQLADMLFDITSHLQTFDTYPPHTIQRLADLILQPHAHYKALAPYLHAVDRTVQVTSGTNIYPLPPPIPDMSSMHLNGEDANDPAVSVAWSNPTTAALGTDEALGGALLTPIPWLTRRSPDSGQNTPGAQIHSESTETIEGPNGVGSIETVSVSVNGIPSTGHARGVTQGELLRQEQRAGVVPVSQLSRAQEAAHEGDRLTLGEEEEEEEELQRQREQEHQRLQQAQEEDEETPHARGPEEIGVDDTGPQSSTTSYVGEGGLEMQGIDVEAAVGRKHDGDDHKAEDSMDADGDAEGESEAKSPSAESVGTKREAEEELDGDALKKVKENGVEGELKDKDTTEANGKEEKKAPTDETKKDDDGDKMDTE